MRLSVKSVAILQIAVIAFLAGSYFITMAAIRDPSDYLPDRIARSDRKGMMYGYVFLPWEDLMASGAADQYMDLVAQSLDFCYVHAQWSVCGLDNDTLNQAYLGNLTSFIAGLGARGVKVVVHEWVSSYSPSWMLAYTPELAGQGERWQGIDPATARRDGAVAPERVEMVDGALSRDALPYFRDHARRRRHHGVLLDDETQSEHWTDFFAALHRGDHAFNATWETMAMFNASTSITSQETRDGRERDGSL